MKVSKEWSESQINKLIKLFHSKPELWDKKHKNRKLRQRALQKIGDTLKVSSKEINRKLSVLRIQFNGELKKIESKRSGKDADETYESGWPYFKALSFLKDNVTRRPTKLKLKTDIDDTVILDDGITERKNDTTGNGSEVIAKNQHQVINNNNKNDYNTLIQSAVHTLAKSDDQYDIFGNYVASEMRNRKSDYLRMKMKRKIQEIMLEINEEEEVLILE